jgi:uncharacterized phage protein (TIGR01671 family)
LREIKFRIWDKKYLTFDHNDSPDVFIGTDGKVYERDERTLGDQRDIEYVESDNYVISQWTGLHDKNGKEIYENDILKIDGMKCVVKYSNLSASYIAECIGEDTYWDLGVYTQKLGIELIGNVFEDGELIANNN